MRLRLKVQLLPEDAPFTRLDCGGTSEAAAFSTEPTAPSQPAPPTLASRERKALKVGQ